MAFLHEKLRRGAWVPPWLAHQNAARYDWAATFVANATVAEIGCGSGHGARRLLDAGATRVDGFDVEPKSIDSARSARRAARRSRS